MKNRSVPSDTVLPHVMYNDMDRALSWLTALGFTEHYRYGEPISGAQIHLGNAYIMLKSARSGNPSHSVPRGQYLTVFVENVDAHFEQTNATGAKIIEEINETCYGERQYVVEDFEGHCWLFSQHVRDVSPEEWGATIARP